MKTKRILIVGYRHDHTLDNINFNKKYLLTSKKAIKYVWNRKELKNVFWIISSLLLLAKVFRVNFLNNYVLKITNQKILRYNIKAFVTFSSNGFIEDFLRKNPTPMKSIEIAHGNYFSMNPKIWIHDNNYRQWDYLFVWSEQQKENLLKVDAKWKDRVFVIGRPQKTYKIDFSDDVFLIKNKILFIGSPILGRGLSVYETRKRYFSELMLWANFNQIGIYYKPHPAEFRSKNKNSIELATLAGMTQLKKNYF